MLFHVINIQTKFIWSVLNLYIFSDIKERSRGWEINLDDEYQNFLYWTPHSSPLIRDGWRTFDSYQYISLRQWKGAMEVIAVMGTKLHDLRKQNVLRSINPNSVKYDTETISNVALEIWSLFSRQWKIVEIWNLSKEKQIRESQIVHVGYGKSIINMLVSSENGNFSLIIIVIFTGKFHV